MKHEHPSFGWLIPAFLSLAVLGWAYSLIILRASAAIADDQEPSYNGRLLSEWLGDMRLSAPGSGPYEAAVRGMGTNAIPTLLKWMSYEPSSSDLSRETEEKVVHWRPVTNLNRYPAQRGERASCAFGYLGAVARSTIPELTRLARTAFNLKRADRFTGALASIGPEAVPSLVSLATNSPPWTRYSAVEALGSFCDEPAVATPLVPMLMNLLCDTNSNTNTDYPVDGPAQAALLAMDAKVVVPSLMDALQSSSDRTRRQAVATLLAFQVQNSTNVPPTAVSVFRAAMRDPDSVVRDVATGILREMGGWQRVGEEWVRRHGTNTLNGITPDFFTKAPPR
ncbi:MAG: HEAT repeat domain-containing protein [Verrucomicrobia bacterium]|nr:HEAT repeat domain-containing protein [Verrucomicrobiota bacterium]